MKNNYLDKQTIQQLITSLNVKESQADAFFKGLTEKGYTLEGYETEPSTLQKIGGAIKNVATGIKEGAVDAVNEIKDINDKVFETGSQQYQKYKAGEQGVVKGIAKSIAGSTEGALQEAGSVAGVTNNAIGQTIGGAFKVADVLAQGNLSEAGKAILATAPVQELLQKAQSGDGLISIDKYNTWKTQNPDKAKNLEAIIDIASLVPMVKGVKDTAMLTKVAGGATKDALGIVVKDTSATLSKIPRATDKLVTIAKESINPIVSKEKAIGEVLQGTTKDIKKASEGLNLIDTTGIKTYKELDNTINNKISTLARTVDNEFAQDTTKTLLDNLTITKPTKAGGSISVNYVDNALKQLEELYNKTGDIVSETDIRDLRNLAQTQGLTKLEINDIARTYGQEFGEKAFGKIGEPLTSVNAQLYENTRKGIKEVARNGLSSDAAKQADQAMSSLYNTRTLVKKNVEAVNKLMNRIEERGLVEKIGHSVSKYADILTGGGLRGFVGGLLPRGAGYKTLNALDLESLLERNLKIIQDASKANTGQEFKTITSQLLSPNSSLKNTANSLNKNISQVKAMGANIKNANIDNSIISDTIPQTKSNASKLSTGVKGKGIIPENSLISEAKKYKSAEEFVKAQGTPIYHGTNADFTVFDKNKIGSQTDEGLFGKGFYFGNTESFAKIAPFNKMGKFAKNIMEIYPSKDAKLFNISKIKTKKEMADLLNMSEDALIQDTNGIIRPVRGQSGQFTSHIQDLGYDGVVVKRSGDAIETVIFEPNKINTKSQLIDIWNKANK